MGAEHAMEVALIGEAQLVCSVRNWRARREGAAGLSGFVRSCRHANGARPVACFTARIS